MTLVNKGSSTINLMRITDDIPGLFEAPCHEQLTIKIDGKAIDDDQYKAEDLRRHHHREGTPLARWSRPHHDADRRYPRPHRSQARKEIEITYPLTAPDPSPGNERVDAPARD